MSMLYENSIDGFWPYIYARHMTKRTNDTSYTQITSDNEKFVRICLTAIPDGVSLSTNEAMIALDVPYRFYILSDNVLSIHDLELLDRFYGDTGYPLYSLDFQLPIATIVMDTPKRNFYMTQNGEIASNKSEFIEYRHLQHRNKPTNIVYDLETKKILPLALPKNSAMIVLIMPQNFIKTGDREGYFICDDTNLIVRIYSRYILSANTIEEDLGVVSVITTEDKRLINTVIRFFSKLNLHHIQTWQNNQIVAVDQYITAIVGNVSNLQIES